MTDGQEASRNRAPSSKSTSPARLAVSVPGLATRVEMDARLVQEVDRAQRYEHPLSLGLIDLDPIPAALARAVNPGRLMPEFVRRVLAAQRDCDVLGTWRDNVLLWILPETELDAAVLACERLRRALAGAAPGNDPPLTVSIGVAEWEPGEEGAELARRAQDALMLSLARGRNCVTRADVLPRPDTGT